MMMPAPEQRHEMIALAAYYLAEARGFAPGGAEADWLTAERTVDALIARGCLSRDAVGAGIRNALRVRDAA